MPWLLIIFVVLPLAELALLLWLSSVTSIWFTIAVVLITAVTGSTVAHRQGLATWRRFQSQLAAGKMPQREISDGILILLAGAFLITPGLITDTMGLLLLVPRFRRIVQRVVIPWFLRRGVVRFTQFKSGPRGTAQFTSFESSGFESSGNVPGGGRVVETEAVRKPD